MKRVIRNNKLDLVGQCIGGPRDGTFVDINSHERLFFAMKERH
jgi:hypothetical protein